MMSDTLKPENAEQLLQAVQWAVAEKQPLEVVAGGSKRVYGRPMQTAATLDLSALSGIKIYADVGYRRRVGRSRSAAVV